MNDIIRYFIRAAFFYILVIAGVTMALVFEAEASDKPGIERMIRTEAKRQGIDPNLALAIAQTESGLNPNAIGSQGEIGVFQLKPQFHAVKRGDTQRNIVVGMKYLVEVKQKCAPKYKDAWIICYNLGPNYSKTIRYPHLFPYYVRVMSLKTKIIAAN